MLIQMKESTTNSIIIIISSVVFQLGRHRHLLMGVLPSPLLQAFYTEKHHEVDPKSVHADEQNSHHHDGHVLVLDRVPHVRGEGCLVVGVLHKAEGIYHQPHIDPRPKHQHKLDA